MPPRPAFKAQPGDAHEDRKPRSRKKSGEPKKTRTKTGCLTCRKRRIKCDEAQPICLNCVKSRRPCDGYNTPIDLQIPTVEPFALDVGLDQYNERHDDSSFSGNHTSHSPNFADHSHHGSAVLPMELPIPRFEATRADPTLAISPFSFDRSTDCYFPPAYDYNEQVPCSLPPHGYSGFLGTSDYAAMTHNSKHVESHDKPNSISSMSASNSHRLLSVPATTIDHVSVSSHSANAPLPQSLTTTENHSPSSYPTQLSTPQSHQALPDFDMHPYMYNENYFHEESEVETGGGKLYGEEGDLFNPNQDAEAHRSMDMSKCWVRHVPIPARPTLDVDVYSCKKTTSPLTDGFTRNVFRHFITTTGAMVTAHDRSSPFDPPLIAQDQSHSAHAGLWTFTLPMMALENHGLLYGMLALASLQLAKADGSHTTSSLKHYIVSLNRVHDAVRDEQTRHHVTTLAATLLLAFYEVATAEHNRWNLHLAGAAQLIREADFAGMTRYIRLLKNETLRCYGSENQHQSEDSLTKHFFDLDLPLVSALVGDTIEIDPQGVVHRQGRFQEQTRAFSHKDLVNYEIMRDLFWWYIRQDVIHGLVGGTPLIFDYENWTDCPPRSPMGLGLSHFGAFDHLLLLLGRLVRFADRDRPRKIRAAEAVAKHSQDDHPSSSDRTCPQRKKTSQPIPKPLSRSHHSKSTPISYGMSPNSREPRMPLSYGVHAPSPAPKDCPETTNPDLSAATSHAWVEWNSIRAAFDVFAAALGPEYKPLPDSPTHLPMESPFGNAFQYRTNGIACVAAWFHMGLLFAMRTQPSMPPAATAAVGAAVSVQTVYLAATIGRIVAGIQPDLSVRPLRPSDAGATCDTFVPLFFAGVQFIDPEQRRWTVEWLRRTEAMTGWASVGLCANGCESAWVRAAELGRGPSYQRTMGFEIGERVEDEVAVKREDEEADCRNTAKTEKVQAGEKEFFRFRRGAQVMTTYALYTSTTDDLSRLSLAA